MYFGIGKLNEECGELSEIIGLTIMLKSVGRLEQLIGKTIPFPVEPHPDGNGELRMRLIEEMSDVQAAMFYFSQENFTEDERLAVHARWQEKVNMFQKWKLTGIPAQPVEKKD